MGEFLKLSAYPVSAIDAGVSDSVLFVHLCIIQLQDLRQLEEEESLV